MMNSTIAKIGYATLTEESENKFSYGDLKYFVSTEAGGREISAEPEGEEKSVYADGITVANVITNNGYKINLTLLSIVDDVEKDWFGNDVSTDGNTIIEKGGASTPKRFALVAAKERYNADTLYEIDTYICCTASRPTRDDKTSEGSFDPNFPQFSISSIPRPDNKITRITTYADELPTSITIPTTVTTTSTTATTKADK
jgi:phi13 family phage major tail protein